MVHCQSGYRSSLATSLLTREGVPNVHDLVGGIEAWDASRLPFAGTAEASTCTAASCS